MVSSLFEGLLRKTLVPKGLDVWTLVDSIFLVNKQCVSHAWVVGGGTVEFYQEHETGIGCGGIVHHLWYLVLLNIWNYPMQ